MSESNKPILVRNTLRVLLLKEAYRLMLNLQTGRLEQVLH